MFGVRFDLDVGMIFVNFGCPDVRMNKRCGAAIVITVMEVKERRAEQRKKHCARTHETTESPHQAGIVMYNRTGSQMGDRSRYSKGLKDRSNGAIDSRFSYLAGPRVS